MCMLLLFLILQHYIKRDLKGSIMVMHEQKASDTDSKFESSSIIDDL